MASINQSIKNYDESLEKSKTVYSGLLGLAIDGSRKVNIPTRAGYVYVRLRDNLSEVIQAYNDKVSPVYDFPVLIERRGNKWYITGRDDQRYETFGTASPFLPQHGDAHSFNRDGGGGGDTVFVYPDQFVPLLVYPSGTTGAGNLMVAPYALQRTSDFIYAGNTGTQNLLVYKPTDSQAIVGLVYLNKTTGNPGVLIASGTPMIAASTGTASVLPYLPYPTSNQEPLYAFRLVSGTTSLTWSNLYNVRQFYGGSSSTSTGSSGGGISGIVVQDEGVTQGTGTVLNFVGDNISVSVSGSVARVFVTGSAGGSLPSFITGSVPFAGSDGQLKENNALLNFDEVNGTLWAGRKPPFNIAYNDFRFFARATGTNTSVGFGGVAAGTGSLGSPSMTFNGYRSRGDFETPLPVQSGDALLSSIGNGFDGANWINASRLRFYADGNWITGSHTPTRMEIDITPSGSATRRTQLSVYGDSVNQPTGSTYNIGGVPHTHAGGDSSAEVNVENICQYGSPGGASGFTALINGAPTNVANSVVTFDTVTVGAVGRIAAISSNALAKMRLYNTTRGNYALINSATGATITVDRNVTTLSAPWQNNDAITVVSTTVVGGGFNWCDMEVVSGIVGRTQVFINMFITSATVGNSMRVHPYDASFSTSKYTTLTAQVANVSVGTFGLITITSGGLFCISWEGTPTTLIWREQGYLR